MKVNIEDILFWMDAIRNSEDRYRTLESFWKGQVNSKLWLIENLEKFLDKEQEYSFSIHGGWNGVLASLIFNSDIKIKQIISLDIDPDCKKIAETVNKRYEMAGKFLAITSDMCSYSSTEDIIINTSCEHITQEQYNKWLSNQNKDSLFVLQSNNYNIPEHLRISTSIQEFIDQSKLDVIWSGELDLPLYKRFMIIGRPSKI
jgi:hypothetical protein